MDSIKILDWITETFGEPKTGGLVQLTEKTSIKKKDQGEAKGLFKITETEVTFQVLEFADAKEVGESAEKWRLSFDAHFGAIARRFHVEYSDIYLGSSGAMKKRASLLVMISLFRKEPAAEKGE